MQVTVIFTEARSFTLELVDAGIYETEKEYEVFVNGKSAGCIAVNISNGFPSQVPKLYSLVSS